MANNTKLSLSARFIGFCGVDDSIQPELLSDLSFHYPWIEWGVLFRPDMEGKPRYATLAFTEKLAKIKSSVSHDIHLAAHFCGRRCEEILEGDYSFTQKVYEFGFRRIQINATLANKVHVDKNNIPLVIDNIRKCILAFPKIEFIIQCNTETMFIYTKLEEIAASLPNMSFLFDSSCGLGVPISESVIPKIHPVIPCGYAGGIGPSTVASTLILLDKIVPANRTIWIDMESSLRELKVISPKDAVDQILLDVFSITNCFSCIQIVVDTLNLPRRG